MFLYYTQSKTSYKYRDFKKSITIVLLYRLISPKGILMNFKIIIILLYDNFVYFSHISISTLILEKYKRSIIFRNNSISFKDIYQS